INDSKLLDEQQKKEFTGYVEENCCYFSANDPRKPEEKIHADILKGKIVSISSGFKEHSTNITISKEFVCYTNRGMRGQGLFPGMSIWRIKDISQLTPEKISKYFDNNALLDDQFMMEQLRTDYKDKIFDDVKFELFSNQKTGNCTFASNITNSWAMAF